jgi:hypothetical protein
MFRVTENVYEEDPNLPGIRVLVAAANTEITDQEAERLGLKAKKQAADKADEPKADKAEQPSQRKRS